MADDLQSQKERLEEIRRERAFLIEQIRRSQETIERSQELISRLDELLSKHGRNS
jgi:hypothetical protein